MLRLTFLGGARTVTGSKFLVEADGHRVLVDCGLFQGLKDLRVQNWAPLPVDPKSIDAVLLTHAHLDHTGYLPLLVRNGFLGKAYCTAPTAALARLLLLDAGRIQEQDALRAAEGGYSKHDPPAPLFARDDAQVSLRRLQGMEPERWHPLGHGLRFRFRPSGHILGSAFVELEFRGTRLVFSGDLGRKKPLLLPPRTKLERADYLILESTYGDRLHSKEPAIKALGRIVQETLERGGDLLIPSFAVGRAQELLLLLGRLRRQKSIPEVPIYLDSPMAIEATQILEAFPDWHALSRPDRKLVSNTAVMVHDLKLSQALVKSRKPKILIAGSGMATGGRILDHLERSLPDPKHTVLLVGYQPEGTRGRLLRDGAHEVKIHGGFVPVKARVEEISSLSAHADQGETLEWLRGFSRPPVRTFLVHGEPQPADALRVKIEASLSWACHVPAAGESVDLIAGRLP